MLSDAFRDEIKNLKKSFLEIFSRPKDLDLVVMGVIIFVAIFAVYLPQYLRIRSLDDTQGEVVAYGHLLEDVRSIEDSYDSYYAHLASGRDDMNQWLEILLSGMRKLEIRVNSLDFRAIALPYDDLQPQVVVMDFEAPYNRILQTVSWLESLRPILTIRRLEVRKMDSGLVTSAELALFTQKLGKNES